MLYLCTMSAMSAVLAGVRSAGSLSVTARIFIDFGNTAYFGTHSIVMNSARPSAPRVSRPFRNTSPSAPVPVHHATTLLAVESFSYGTPTSPPSDFFSTFISPRSLSSSYKPLSPPTPSPCSSPPLNIPPSGYLEEAKGALANAVAKRHTKASSLSIDDDMRDMCHYYRLLGTEERVAFLHHLALHYSTDHAAVIALTAHPPQHPLDTQCSTVWRWSERLRAALVPPHYWVATQISRLTGGVKFLIDLRHDLLVAQSISSKGMSDVRVRGGATEAVTGIGVSGEVSNSNNVSASSSDCGGDSNDEVSEESAAAALRSLDLVLRELLSLWFTVGLLQLARITWQSSCSMLQKISEYEAVHPVRNWSDLKRRVGLYRRCFVFTHACMPAEPLVVLHTFLTNGITRSMSKIVDNPSYQRRQSRAVDVWEEEEDPTTITTVIFYSITSTQKGLQGIELGNYLIKRVVKELQAELPHLSQFSSLSPVPGFVKWLHTALAKGQRGEQCLFTQLELSTLRRLLSISSTQLQQSTIQQEFTTSSNDNTHKTMTRTNNDTNNTMTGSNDSNAVTTRSVNFEVSSSSMKQVTNIRIDIDQVNDEVAALTTICEQGKSSSDVSAAETNFINPGSSVTDSESADIYQRMRQQLNTNKWAEHQELSDFLEEPLLRICAHYLYSEKRRGYALDSVAHFHLKNGAMMWRINWAADRSPRGLSNSCGIMVNYRYFLEDSENNSREYQENMTLNAAPAVITAAATATRVMSGGGGESDDAQNMPVIVLPSEE